MTPNRFAAAAFLFFWMILAGSARGASDPGQGFVRLTWENDGFHDSDRYYTNGFRLNWISPDLGDAARPAFLPAWVDRASRALAKAGGGKSRRALSLSLGQSIYTPRDLTRSDLMKDDRPYAGLTYVAAGFHVREGERLDVLELAIGIVGKHSYAQAAQEWVHEYIGGYEPRGWEHQLQDEPILELTWQRRLRLIQRRFQRGIGYDLLWQGGGGVGNLSVHADTGFLARAGWFLPDDFGPAVIHPATDSRATYGAGAPRMHWTDPSGLYFFVGATGSGVAHNIFLDGNTLRESHSVKRTPWVGEAMAGLGVTYGNWQLTYAHVYRSREYSTQVGDQIFGSLGISYAY